MDEIDSDVMAGQSPAEAPNDFDRKVRRRREIDRNQGAPQLHVAADLIDEAAGSRGDEQRRDRRAAEYGLRHRALQPVRDAVAPMGRQHDQIAFMIVEKIDDRSCRLLQLQTNVVDFDAELAGDNPGRIVLGGESPLGEQPQRVRERQCFGGVIL